MKINLTDRFFGGTIKSFTAFKSIQTDTNIPSLFSISPTSSIFIRW